MKLILWGCLIILSMTSSAQTLLFMDGRTFEPIPDVEIIGIDTAIVLAKSNIYGEVQLHKSWNQSSIYASHEMYDIKKIELTSIFENEENEIVLIRLNRFEDMYDEVVVSATRWDQKNSEVPIEIATLSKRDIALQNPQTAADLLAITGKVFIQKSQQGGGSPMIRGFATNRLLYAVDGVRMNTAIFRGGNIQNVISLDPFSMESAEVLFGPGSILYGSDAIGGVMSFQTLKPELSLNENAFLKGNSVARYSSANNEKTAHFDINVGWKKWAIVTSFSANDYGDLKMGSYGPKEYLRPFYVERINDEDVIVENVDNRVQAPSGYSQMNLMQKVRFSPNDKLDIIYGFHYSETSDYSRYDRHIRYKNGGPRYGEWKYGPQKWLMNNLSVQYHAENKMFDELSIRLAQQQFEESRISRDFNKVERETRLENVDAYSGNIDFLKSLSKSNKLYYGIEAVQNTVRSEGIDEDISTGIKTSGAARYPNSYWQSFGFYITNQHSFNKKLILSGGLRYNLFKLNADFDTTFYPFPFQNAKLQNGAMTGSLGLVYKPSKSWVISTNASTAFRSPNVDDVGKVFDSEPGAVTVPNPNLEAEYAYNIDFSVAKTFGPWLKVDATAFYTYLQNALVRRNFQLDGADSIMYDGELSQVQAIQNAASANVYGLQAGIEILLTNGFSITSDFNYQLGEEELDDGSVSPSRHSAPWFGTSRLKYNNGRLSMQFYFNYSGSKSFDEMPISEIGKDYMYAIDNDGNPYSPSWYTMNFKAMYNFEKNIGVSAGLENITDQRYRPFSSGIVAPGRNVVLSVRFIF